MAGGVGGVAEPSPAANLHIVEVVFARAGCWGIANSIIYSGLDGFIGPVHQASGVAIGKRGVGSAAVPHHRRVKPALAGVINRITVGGEEALVEKDKSIIGFFNLWNTFEAQV